MPVPSLYPLLEPLRQLGRKPVQYVGGEVNSVVKDWDATEVRWALMYPDAYEVGVPNQGIQILYEILNARDGVLAERTYSVWPDLEGLMRQHQVPQFTVDAHRPVRAFDVLGVSFATELGYTNLLPALDLALPAQAARAGRRVGARAAQRGDLPRLHPGLPVLPGRDDHPAGPRALGHHDRRDGRRRAEGQRVRRSGAAVAVQR